MAHSSISKTALCGFFRVGRHFGFLKKWAIRSLDSLEANPTHISKKRARFFFLSGTFARSATEWFTSTVVKHIHQSIKDPRCFGIISLKLRAHTSHTHPPTIFPARFIWIFRVLDFCFYWCVEIIIIINNRYLRWCSSRLKIASSSLFWIIKDISVRSRVRFSSLSLSSRVSAVIFYFIFSVCFWSLHAACRTVLAKSPKRWRIYIFESKITCVNKVCMRNSSNGWEWNRDAASKIHEATKIERNNSLV